MQYRVVVISLFMAVAALLATPREPALAAPLIAVISPSSGLTTGGTVVTITGNGFVPGASVSFAGVLSPSVNVANQFQLTAVAPAGVAGPVMVVVINPGGESAFVSSGFKYIQTSITNNGFSITGINPPSGNLGQLVTVTGTGFQQGVNAFFGGVPTETVWITAGYVMTYAPSGASGAVAVMLANPDGSSATSPTLFTYAGTTSTSNGGVTITAVSPSSVTAGSTVSIFGTGFVAGASVTIGGYPATNVAYSNSGLITATVPSGPAGTVTVNVSNAAGTFATYSSLIYTGTSTSTVSDQPNVSSVSPSSGSSAGGSTVSITGSGFVAPVTVTFGGVPATSVNVVNANLITATTPANPVGAVPVVVANPAGALGGLTAGFTYELAWPRVTSLSPSTGALVGGTTLTINGTGFAPGATVTVGGQSAATVSAVSPTQIVVTTPPGPPGAATVLVTNPGGAISGLATGFSYSANPQAQAPPPSTSAVISSVSPPVGSSSGGTSVRIYGTGFQRGATVTISGISVPATFISSTQLAVTTPAVTGTGSVTVTVANPDSISAAALPNAFTYTSGGTSTPPPPSTNSPLPAGGGLFVFSGGTNAQLVTASGCNAATSVFWTTDSTGAWVGYIPSAPVTVVNAAWNRLFPTSIPAGTPIVARC